MEGPGLADILLATLPLLLLIAGWYTYMRSYGGRGAQYPSLERRKVEALERIADALEKRQ